MVGLIPIANNAATNVKHTMKLFMCMVSLSAALGASYRT